MHIIYKYQYSCTAETIQHCKAIICQLKYIHKKFLKTEKRHQKE